MFSLSKHVKSYFAETSLHGLKYITEEGRVTLERLLWVILVCSGIVLAVIFMLPGINKYIHNPTSTSLDTRDHPVWEVDFPGVTICPNNKIIKSRFRAAMKSKKLPWYNITQKMNNETSGSGDEFQFELLHYLTNLVMFSIDPEGVEPLRSEKIQEQLDNMGRSVSRLMRLVAPDCKRMMLVCRWHGEYQNCSELFESTKTDDGFCCSFNTVSLAEGFSKVELDVSAANASPEPDYDYYGSYDYLDYDYEGSGSGEGSGGSEDGSGNGAGVNGGTGVIGYDVCPALTDSTSGGTGLWYTGCYINDEDACLEDQIRGNTPSLSESQIFPDEKALTLKNVTKVKKRKTNGASKTLGLSVLLDPTLHDFVDAGASWEDQQRIRPTETSFYKGWKVHVHDPAEFPEVKKKGILVGVGQEVSISVTAEVTEADDQVRGMAPDRRRCLLRPEINTELYEMKMFNEYKKSSCLLECQAEELIKRYECLPYYMPSLPLHFINQFLPSNQSIDCSFSQLRAMANDIAKLSALGDGSEFRGLISGLSCPACPDECEATVYSAQVSTAKFQDIGNFFYRNLFRKGTAGKPVINKQIFKEYETFFNRVFGSVEVQGPPTEIKDPRPEEKGCMERTVRNKISKMTYLHVYFKSFGMTKFARKESFGWQDLIAFFGGIVGLCMGFSLLSGAELLYFFTLRLMVEQSKVQDDDDDSISSGVKLFSARAKQKQNEI